MKPTKKKRVKHPGEVYGAVITNEWPWPIRLAEDDHTPESARALAAWLIKAASYLEQKEAKR